jgi:hypothetical protein
MTEKAWGKLVSMQELKESSGGNTCDDRHAWSAPSYSRGERVADSVVKVLSKCSIDLIIRRHNVF